MRIFLYQRSATQRNGAAAVTSKWCGATHSNQYAELQTITSVQRPAPNCRSTATGSASDRRPRDCARMPTGLPTCLSWRAKYDVQRLLHHSCVPEALLMTTRMEGRVPQAKEKKLKEWKQRLDRRGKKGKRRRYLHAVEAQCPWKSLSTWPGARRVRGRRHWREMKDMEEGKAGQGRARQDCKREPQRQRASVGRSEITDGLAASTPAGRVRQRREL
ncbi:hypothetical protein IWX90DRAFT_423775 [Phyllosticta citrichinensis]|uniref:Uncharacterized protein n=1 Tax=Phyllosticta citrichinensis TaxID=1130410 RepID=A0ABR1Y286_9PEZI